MNAVIYARPDLTWCVVSISSEGREVLDRFQAPDLETARFLGGMRKLWGVFRHERCGEQFQVEPAEWVDAGEKEHT